MATRFSAIAISIFVSPIIILYATPSQAFQIFRGYDRNPIDRTVLPLERRINTLVQSSAFLQGINSSVTTESFEDHATNQKLEGLTFTTSGITATARYLQKSTGTAASATVQKANRQGLTNAGTFPTHGVKGISINSANHFEFQFSESLAAFSFWGTDLGDLGNRLTVEFYRGNQNVGGQAIDYLDDQAGKSSVFFFGGIAQQPDEYFDLVKLISSRNSSSGDAIGLDQLTIATPSQVIALAPEAAAAVPTPALLPSLLAFGLRLARKRFSQGTKMD